MSKTLSLQYGGSFDPIHYGHIVPVLHAMHYIKASKVIYTPTYVPPHKEKNNFSFQSRIMMIDCAIRDMGCQNHMVVSPVERKLSGYTIDSLREHKTRMGNHSDVKLLIGDDQATVFNTWYKWEDILEEFGVVVMSRNKDNFNKARAMNLPGMKFVRTMNIAASSTKIREKISEKGIDKRCCLTTPSVVRYINDNIGDYNGN